jgi:hypothetical protein
VINADNSLSLARKAIDPGAVNADSLTAELYFGDYLVSDFVVDLTTDRNWVNVNTIALPDEYKALVVNLNPTDAPGISTTHSLFIVKGVGQTSVRVCTDATLIADVNSSCTGYVLNVGDPSLSSVNIDGIDYWKVTGLTGTGAMGVTPPPPSPTPTPSPSSGSSGGSSGGSSSSGSGGSTGSAGCTASEVGAIPNLFQINVLGDSAKLFFSPIPDVNTFYFSYATRPDALEYGVEATLAREGVQNYTISLLRPNTVYYFKVRGQNGCKSGEWSNIMQIRTQRKGAISPIIYYKSTQPKLTNVRRKPLTVSKVTTAVMPESSPPAWQQKTVIPKTEPSPPKKCYLWGLWCR